MADLQHREPIRRGQVPYAPPIASASPASERLNARPATQSALQMAARLNDRASAQRAATPTPNRTGLPDGLKAGIEALSGMSLDDVRVHYNSSKPAQLQAHAYAQGTDIHLAPGQDRHLPHEAWHVVQQKQGRVKPTMQMTGVGINDDTALEREADVMGAKALGGSPTAAEPAQRRAGGGSDQAGPTQLQRDMAIRVRQKNELKKVRKKLVEARNASGDRLARPAEIKAHDVAQNAGVHNPARAVTLNQLIGDLNTTLQNLTDLNLRDSDALGVEKKHGRGEDHAAIQLKVVAPFPERGLAGAGETVNIALQRQAIGGLSSAIVQRYANLEEVNNPKFLASSGGLSDQFKLEIANWCLGRGSNAVRGSYSDAYQHNHEDIANNINYTFAFNWGLAAHVDLGGGAHNGVDTPHLQAVRTLQGMAGTTQATVAITKTTAAGQVGPAPLIPPLAFTSADNAVALGQQETQNVMENANIDGVRVLTQPKLRAFGEAWASAFADKDSGAKEARADEADMGIEVDGLFG